MTQTDILQQGEGVLLWSRPLRVAMLVALSLFLIQKKQDLGSKPKLYRDTHIHYLYNIAYKIQHKAVLGHVNVVQTVLSKVFVPESVLLC